MKRLVSIFQVILTFTFIFGVVSRAAAQSNATGSNSGENTNPGVVTPPPGGCGCGETCEAPVSIFLNMEIGTSFYAASNRFVGADIGERIPRFKTYNPPELDKPPIDTSLSEAWKQRYDAPVVLGIVQESITNVTFTPAVLELSGGVSGSSWVKKDSNGALRQILTDEYLTDIKEVNGTTLISLYLKTTIGGINTATGLYTIPSTAKLYRT